MTPSYRALAWPLLLLLSIETAQAQANNSSAESVWLGQRTFAACAGCHGLDGAGGEHAPDIADDARIQKMPDGTLLRVIRKGTSAGMPAFEKVLDENQLRAVVAYLRVLQGGHAKSKITGNPESGRALYFGRAACAECHSVNGQGGFLGSDLSGYGKLHSPDMVREAILSPNKNLDPRHGTVSVSDRAGETYRGVIRNEDNFSIQMQTANGTFHLFEKSNLTRIVREPVSLMPADYARRLSRTEIDDLISFLAQGSGQKKEESDDDDQ